MSDKGLVIRIYKEFLCLNIKIYTSKFKSWERTWTDSSTKRYTSDQKAHEKLLHIFELLDKCKSKSKQVTSNHRRWLRMWRDWNSPSLLVGMETVLGCWQFPSETQGCYHAPPRKVILQHSFCFTIFFFVKCIIVIWFGIKQINVPVTSLDSIMSL